MLFAIELLNQMETKYPGVLAAMQQSTAPEIVMAQKRVSSADYTCMIALMHWRRDKVIYIFEEGVAREIMEQTDDPERTFPLSCMRQLPYPCIAVHVSPITIVDPGTQEILEEYTGNAFLWLDGDCLFSAWQLEGDKFLLSQLDLKDGMTIDDCYENIVTGNLERFFSVSEITEIKRKLGIRHFSDLSFLSANALGQQSQPFNTAIRLSNVQEILMQRALHVIFYLGCENADIEAAEEKLRKGTWASSVGGKPREVKRNERRQALRETEGFNINDVGYRIAGKYRRSYSTPPEKSPVGDGSGKTQGYSKRRAHFHHFWIGPRNGVIANDIMNPKPGERGLRLRWIEATEIHPELRNDDATLVDVEKLP